MRLSLFSRMVIGYLVIFVLVLAVSLYAIAQLHRFNVITRSVLETDNRVLDYQKKLSDTLLEEIRYERKFVITQDDSLYNRFLMFKRDFEQYLQEMHSVEDSRLAAGLERIREYHQSYQALFNQEVEFVKTAQSYPEAQYNEKKGKIQDLIMEELEKIKADGQQNTYEKIRRLDEIGVQARQVTMLITAVCLMLVMVVSLLVTRSITHPIAMLKAKTREIARGHFDSRLKLSSPPEVADLASAFNFMCERLKDLDRMKSEFFSSMSHELRTPMTSIKEGTGLLLEGAGGPVTEKQKKLLTILAEESARLIDLVNSLLDLSKMEAGMMTYHFERGSLEPLIRRATIEMAPLVEAKKIHLETKIGEPLPAVRMDGDRMLQALRNLIGNAVKFTPEGGRISVRAQSTDSKLEVSVMDTGVGVAAENLPAIFDKYHQASSGADRMQGTGLGLAIVKHIITSHGGKVWAESEPGKGSTFTFLLPS